MKMIMIEKDTIEMGRIYGMIVTSNEDEVSVLKIQDKDLPYRDLIVFRFKRDNDYIYEWYKSSPFDEPNPYQFLKCTYHRYTSNIYPINEEIPELDYLFMSLGQDKKESLNLLFDMNQANMAFIIQLQTNPNFNEYNTNLLGRVVEGVQKAYIEVLEKDAE